MLALVTLPACSRQPQLLSGKESPQSLPFNNFSQSGGISPTQAFGSTSIPDGTVIVVRLQSSLSSAEAHSGDQFDARMDGPIVLQGQTLAPSGTVVTGRVLVAKASTRGEPGYLRLTLSSVILNNKALDVHTSSVFAKGDSRERPKSAALSSPDVQFSTDRRLAFRLIQALPLQE
jgi:hypothetical protein